MKPTDNYYTPNTTDQPVIQLVKAVISEIDLDPCTDSRSIVPASVRWTIADDCLSQTDWRYNQNPSRVFMNPPFSNPSPFLKALVDQFEKGNVSEAIVLLKLGTLANRGTGKILKRAANTVCIWGCESGRLAFFAHNEEREELEQRFGADFDCCLVGINADKGKFDYHFSNYGNVLIPYW